MRKGCFLFVSVLGVTVFSQAIVVHANTIVLKWNKTMLSAIAQNPPAPTATTWRMDVVSTAMYNAWTAYDAVALSTTTGDTLRRPVEEHTEENQAAAVSYAAYQGSRQNRAILYDKVKLLAFQCDRRRNEWVFHIKLPHFRSQSESSTEVSNPTTR